MSSSFLIFEQIEPSEVPQKPECIWCGENRKKNKAHIFSKRIINKNTALNTLKSSVCIVCNSFFGNTLENYLFSKTPLGFVSDLFLRREFSSLKWIPNYYWDKALENWVVLIPDKTIGKNILPKQIILSPKNELLTFIGDWKGSISNIKNNKFRREIQKLISEQNFTIHISEKYPENFYPRVFAFNNKLIITGRTQRDVERLKDEISKAELQKETEYEIFRRGTNIDLYQIKFEWNLRTYFDYCAKIAYECFSLLTEHKYSTHPGFKELRETVLKGNNLRSLDILYTEKEKQYHYSNRLVPQGWISYCEVDSRISIFPLKDGDDSVNHSVYVYTLSNGLVCATIKLFNLPLAAIILGNTFSNEIFNCFRISYDLDNSKIAFYKSITDKDRVEEFRREIRNELKSKNYISFPT